MNLAQALARFEERWALRNVGSHCPRAEEETHVLLIEPRETRNTGDVETPSTTTGLDL